MPERPKDLAPAKYIGNHAVELGQGKTYYNVDGSRKKENYLETGDTLLLLDEDVYGKTLWHDPKGNQQSLHVGLGRCVMEQEHAEMSPEELGRYGYEFHMGRQDMEPLEPLESYIAKSKPSEDGSPKTIANSVTITESDDTKIEEVPDKSTQSIEGAEDAEGEKES